MFMISLSLSHEANLVIVLLIASAKLNIPSSAPEKPEVTVLTKLKIAEPMVLTMSTMEINPLNMFFILSIFFSTVFLSFSVND